MNTDFSNQVLSFAKYDDMYFREETEIKCTYSWHVSTCPYCNARLKVGKKSSNPHKKDGYETLKKERVLYCPDCGWYQYSALEQLASVAYYYCAHGILMKFDLDDINVPILELQNYLIRNYEARFDIHPRKLEELVESVFMNMGYTVELTSYTKDHGIDLYIIRNGDGKQFAVQAKRFRQDRKIGISAIREFLGAMLLNKAPSGIYVTTSEFTKGCYTAVESQELNKHKLQLELWDANRLFSVLELYRNTEALAWELFWESDRTNLWACQVHLRDGFLGLLPPSKKLTIEQLKLHVQDKKS